MTDSRSGGALAREPRTRGFEAIVGEDAELRAALARAARVAPTRVPVLVTGESGTGKELLARALHDLGPAPAGPFVAVNCGTLPAELAESELFGHERGAFTGASGRRPGWFAEAHGGTLVLDEVGELPPALQPKLLRVLETGRMRRVGGTGEVAIDVRVVALTLRDLRRDGASGRFRTDLYHRLAGFELALPPLRRRRADIPLLCRIFLDELAAEMGPRTLAPEALDRLLHHDWPGNVRELRNVLRRAAILCPDRIGADALGLAPGGGRPAATGSLEAFSSGPGGYLAPPRLADDDDPTPPASWAQPAPARLQAPANDVGGGDLLCLGGRTFDDIERAVLRWALERAGGSRRRAARALAMARSTFCDKVKRYGLA